MNILGEGCWWWKKVKSRGGTRVDGLLGKDQRLAPIKARVQSVQKTTNIKGTSKTNPYDTLKKNKIPQTLTDEEIAAANKVDLQMSLKKIDDKYLKKQGIDAHELKSDFVGNKNISKYDLYVETETGEVFIYQKGAKGQGIATGEYIK